MTTTAATSFKLIDLTELLRFRINDNISVKKKRRNFRTLNPEERDDNYEGLVSCISLEQKALDLNTFHFNSHTEYTLDRPRSLSRKSAELPIFNSGCQPI